MHSLYKLLLAALAVIVWTASSSGSSHAMASSGEPGPETAPVECYCAECGMYVKTEGLFAAQIIFKDKKTAWLCDIGDMLIHYDGLGGDASVKAVYVRDYASGAWTDGRQAFYLTGAKVRTPMSYGILAFADRSAAEKFSRESGGGRVVSFEQALASRVWEE